MRIDHRCLDAAVTQQLLHGANVVTRLEQVCRKRVAQRVTTGRFGDATHPQGFLEGALYHRLVQMVATPLTGRPILILLEYPVTAIELQEVREFTTVMGRWRFRYDGDQARAFLAATRKLPLGPKALLRGNFDAYLLYYNSKA